MEASEPTSERVAEPSPLQDFGSGLVLMGGAALIVALNLHFVGHLSVWGLTTRLPVLLTVLAAAAMVLAVAELFSGRSVPLFCLGQAALGCYLFGQVFPIGESSYEHLGVGFWFESAGGLVMAVGGVLALWGSLRPRASRR